jgi:polar amino acid transport system permease protein
MAILAVFAPGEIIDKYFNIDYGLQFLPHLLYAARLTILLSLAGEFFGIIIGLAMALMRLSHHRLIRAPAVLYINLFRGTPLLVQLMFIYFALPFAGVNLEPIQAGMVGLALNSGAYVAEIFRAGIQSVHRGQMEAARSLGMSHAQAMRYVILPQAFRVVIPPLTNEFVALLKDSSLASVILVQELAYQMRALASATYNLTSYTMAAALYLIMTLPLSRLSNYLEKKLKVVKR